MHRKPAGGRGRRFGHLRRWGAVYIMVALFLGSWGGQFVTTILLVREQAQEHGEAFSWVAFWPEFLATTLENWQSEWLQLIFQAVMLLGLKHVLFKAEAEDMEVIQQDLVEIKEALGLPGDSPGEEHTTG